MKLLSLLISLILISSSAIAEELIPSRVVRVIDGDTFTVDIDGLPDVFGKDLPVRIKGIDTPELRGRCYNEKIKALEAKKELEKVISESHQIILQDVERGKYFRIVSDVIVVRKFDTVDIGSHLLDLDLAVRYPKVGNPWCG